VKVIASVSDGNGLLFGGRRLSRDSAVISDIERITFGDALFLSDYSYALFEESEISTICVSNPIESAGDGDFVFFEGSGISAYKDKIESIILYRWNRKYPFDVRFDIDPEKEGFTLTESIEFQGNSHEKITREIWER
jgi:hypothetical protein